SNASLGAVPHRSLAIRAPSTVRCSILVPHRARLRLVMGFEGQGEGDADVRVARDGAAALALRAEHLKGGERAEWVRVEVDLDAFAGQVVTLELRSLASTPGGRILFGDPMLYIPSPEASIPASRLAVIVIMSGLERSKLENHQRYPAIGDLDRT